MSEEKLVLQELFKEQQEHLNFFCNALNMQEAEKALEMLSNCSGKLIFSGVGKSGLVAQKIAWTMTSVGIKSLFLCPLNALHGDLGIVSPNDLFVLLSKSGESEELLQLIPFLRNRKISVLSLLSRKGSRLEKASDFTVLLPVKKELCPFDLAPTTSTAIQLLFGDLLAVALMRQKNFSLDQYALNHPAGRIGRRISLKVSDLMIKEEGIPICSPNDLLIDTLVELSNKKCGALLILNEERKLLGIFTDGDLRRSLQSKGTDLLQLPMGQLMNRTARVTYPHQLASKALQEMEADQKHPIAVLPVINENEQVVGILRMHDIIQSGIA